MSGFVAVSLGTISIELFVVSQVNKSSTDVSDSGWHKGINSEVFFKNNLCWPQTESGCIIDPEIGKRFPGHFRFGIIK